MCISYEVTRMNSMWKRFSLSRVFVTNPRIKKYHDMSIMGALPFMGLKLMTRDNEKARSLLDI